MASRIEQIIDEIEDYIDGCKTQAFAPSKIIVNRETMEELLNELRSKTPDEIKRYQKIISNQDAILNEARAQADAMVAMAKNPNGGMNSMAGMGMQMSAGMAFGGMMAGQMNGGVQGQSGTQKESFVICPKCGSEMKKGLKFCSECGASLVVQKKKCIKCGAEINADMKFCPECGANQAQPVCPKCGYKAAAGQKFCPECGTSLL